MPVIKPARWNATSAVLTTRGGANASASSPPLRQKKFRPNLEADEEIGGRRLISLLLPQGPPFPFHLSFFSSPLSFLPLIFMAVGTVNKGGK